MSSVTKKCMIAALSLLALAAVAQAQPVIQLKGVDSMVDYKMLKAIGPWDDRNYQLTGKDLELLADNESELRAQIPAFFRVELRKGIPEMQRTGPVQYPRSALQTFKLMYGGYLVDGKIYQGATITDGEYKILTERGGVDEKEFWTEKFLNGEVRITSPNGAAESAIKINPVDTNLVIAGSNGPGSGQIMHYSSDGGDTWNTSAALPLGGTCCDPTVDWSSDGLTAYTATLGNCGGAGCQIWFYRSSDFGQTWNDLSGSRRVLSSGNANDKEFIHVDKFATSPFKDNIYATWHSSNIMQFAASSDSGDTWSNIVFSSATDQRGIGSDITTDKGGDVYYFWPAFNSQRILLRKSSDGGATLGAVSEVASTEGSFAFPVPSMETREVFIYVSADTDYSNGPFADSIYAAWTDSTGATGNNANNNHSRIQVAYSRNGGSTWNVTTPHETADANSVDRWHQWLTVGDDGTVHVVFYDTRNGGRTTVDLYYSFSDDGAQTWSAPSRVTSEQSPNIGDTFEFGDYNGLDIVLQDLIAIYTDNRNEGGGSGDSVDVYAAGIPVTGGCTPQAIADAGADRTINEGDSTTLGTSAQAGHTYSWSPGGATTAQITVSPTTTTTYTVTATTSCGSNNDSVTVTVIPAGTGGPQTAVFNAGLGAPACATVGSSCDSTTLVDSRNSLSPAEPNQPNTLDGCADGTSGTYHSDESNDRIVVSTLDSGNFTEGDTVEIAATVWAWTTPSEDTLDLFYAADANSPTWVLIGSVQPSVVGANTLTAQYVLPAGSLQAVRAQFRYQSTNAECSAGNWNDRDDLVFAVEADGPVCTLDSQCDDGAFCNGAETCNTGTGQCEAGTAPTCDDGAFCNGTETCNEATDSCDAGTAPACNDGQFCNGTETCNEGTDSCDAGTPPVCDDGAFCNGTETCNEGTDSCDAGTAPCDPGTETCNEGTDTCELIGCTLDSQCDDGAFCNGTETCNLGTGVCETGTPPVCDDGAFCNGTETCNEGTDSCDAGTAPCSGGETCNETTDTCEGGGGDPVIWMSFRSNTAVPGVGTVRDEDIVSFDEGTGTWALEFDGSDVGLGSLEISALGILPSGNLLLSFTAAGTVGGLSVDDSDIVEFTPTSLGSTTAGTFSLYFDGSDVALTSNGEDVDGIAFDSGGGLIISTTGGFSGTGASGADEDLFLFTGTFGPSTSGSFSRVFDGSDVGLGGNGAEDVDAAAFTAAGELLFSTVGNFSVTGLTGTDEDIVEFTGTFGNSTSGTFSLRQDLSALGIAAGEDIGSMHLFE